MADPRQEEDELAERRAAPLVSALTAALTQQRTQLVTGLGDGVQAAPRTLAEREERMVPLAQAVGRAWLAGAGQPSDPGPGVPGQPRAGGGRARYHQQRGATVRTVPGEVPLERADDHGARCGHGPAPWAQRRGYCAGRTRAGSAALLALAGARADPCAAATTLLGKLTRVRGWPTLARTATARLGTPPQAGQEGTRTSARDAGTLPSAAPAPTRLSLPLAGVSVPTDDGWREYQRGTASTTRTRPDNGHPGGLEVVAREQSYLGALGDAAPLGRLRWCAAARRGALAAEAVVVVAEGAHRRGALGAAHCPDATPLVDRYHASGDVGQAAQASYGEGHERGQRWAKKRLDE